MGAGPNWVDEDSPLPSRKEPIKSIKSLQSPAASHKVMYPETIEPLVICIDLGVQARFWKFQKSTVELLLGASFIKKTICGIFSTECKMSLALRSQSWLFWRGQPLIRWTSIIQISKGNQICTRTLQTTNLIYVASRNATIRANKRAAVFVSLQGSWFMTMGTQGHVVRRRIALRVRGVMNILPGTCFCLYGKSEDQPD